MSEDQATRMRLVLHAPDWTLSHTRAALIEAGWTAEEVEAFELYIQGFRQVSRAHGTVARCPLDHNELLAFFRREWGGFPAAYAGASKALADQYRRVYASGDDKRHVSDKTLAALRGLGP